MRIKSDRHNSTPLTFYICSSLCCSWGLTSLARAWAPVQQGWEEEEELIRSAKPTLRLHFIFPGCLRSLVNFRDKRKILSQSCQHWGTRGWDFITWTPWRQRLLSWLNVIKSSVNNIGINVTLTKTIPSFPQVQTVNPAWYTGNNTIPLVCLLELYGLPLSVVA